MYMGACAMPRAAHSRNRVSQLHLMPQFDVESGIMAIPSYGVIAMVDYDCFTKTGLNARKNNNSIGRSYHVRAHSCCNINTVVKLSVSCPRRNARAKP